MKLVKAKAEIVYGRSDTVKFWSKFIELCARNCYKSEGKIVEGSADTLIAKLISREHWTPFEFWDVTVRFICDRGISHELVRHRLCSFLQESTRYCDYENGDLCFVIPYFVTTIEPGNYDIALVPEISFKIGNASGAELEWYASMADAEERYKLLREHDVSPQGARSVLPNSLKTEVICKANLREWRHIFNLRCAKAAHPDMRSMMLPLLKEFIIEFPGVFDDLGKLYEVQAGRND